MNPARRMRLAYVLIALHLVIILVPGAIANIWPPRTSDVVWRIVFSTQLFNGLGLTLVGLAVLLLVGYLAGSRWLAIAVTTAAGLLVAASGAIALLLLLDFLQIRPTVQPDARRQWDVSVLVPIVSAVIVSICLLVVAVGGWAVRKQLAKVQTRPRDQAPSPLVVGR